MAISQWYAYTMSHFHRCIESCALWLTCAPPSSDSSLSSLHSFPLSSLHSFPLNLLLTFLHTSSPAPPTFPQFFGWLAFQLPQLQSSWQQISINMRKGMQNQRATYHTTSQSKASTRRPHRCFCHDCLTKKGKDRDIKSQAAWFWHLYTERNLPDPYKYALQYYHKTNKCKLFVDTVASALPHPHLSSPLLHFSFPLLFCPLPPFAAAPLLMTIRSTSGGRRCMDFWCVSMFLFLASSLTLPGFLKQHICMALGTKPTNKDEDLLATFS